MDKETQKEIVNLTLQLHEHTAQVKLLSSIVEDQRRRGSEQHREIFGQLEQLRDELRNGIKSRLQSLEENWKFRNEMHTTRKADWKDYLTLLLAAIAIAVALFKNT